MGSASTAARDATFVTLRGPRSRDAGDDVAARVEGIARVYQLSFALCTSVTRAASRSMEALMSFSWHISITEWM